MSFFDDVVSWGSEQVESVGNFVSDTVSDIAELPDNIVREANHAWDVNKDGINSGLGLLARGAASYYTLGASEALGVGSYFTKQFGGSESTQQYGGLVGTVGGIAGAGAAATGNHALNAYTSGTKLQAGQKLIGKLAGGNQRVPTAQPQRMPASGSVNNGGNMNGGFTFNTGYETADNFLNTYGNDLLDSALGGLFGRNEEPKGVNEYQDRTPQGGSSGQYTQVSTGLSTNKILLYGLGGFAALAALLMVAKK